MRLSKKAAMLVALAETGNVRLAAEAAGIHRATHYRWLDEDPKYALAVSDAMENAADLLEAEAKRRAVEGVAEPLVSAGKLVTTVQRYSDTLLIFLLKGARPEKYRERVSVVTEDAVDAEIRRLSAIVARRAATSEAAGAEAAAGGSGPG